MSIGGGKFETMLKSSKTADSSPPSEYFYRLSCSCRRESPGSNTKIRGRFERTRRGRRCSRHPSAMKQGSSRLRRQVLRTIEHELSPQSSFTPPRPTSLPELRMIFIASSPGKVGQAGLCGRLRSNSSSKLLHAGRRRRELILPLQRAFPTIVGPAGRARSANLFSHSSKGIPLGTKTITDNPPPFLIPMQMSNFPEHRASISAGQNQIQNSNDGM